MKVRSLFRLLGAFVWMLGFALPFGSIPLVKADTASVVQTRNSLRSGSWSFQFEVTEDFTLKDFNGLLLSIKKHTSAGKAFRLGLGISGSITDFDLTNTYQQDTLFQQFNRDADLDAQRFDFLLQYLSYPSPDADVNLFLGGGPLVQYSHAGSKSGYGGSISKSDQITWVAGIAGLLGAEWFATKSISFLAEYGLALEYQLRKNTSTYQISSTNYSSKNEQKETSLRVNPAAVKIGLSVYF